MTERHSTPLAGSFQERNAALAVRAAEELRPVLAKITAEAIERGVAATSWRGRLEKIDRAGKEVWIDGGHNAHAVRAIVPFIAEQIAPPRLLVFGIMSDKDVDDVTAMLFPMFESIIATEPYPPRSAPADDLAALARSMSIEAIAEPDPSRAITRALGSGYRSILVAGSLYLAGAAIAFFDAHGHHQGSEQK